MKTLLLSLVLLVPASSGATEGSFFRYLQATADLGDAESQLVLGLAHRDGWDGAIKPDSALAKWRELAGELGDHRAFLLLGLLQRETQGLAKNSSAALRWIETAADRGDDYARVILGDMLLEGDGVRADWRRGVALFEKSANAGFAPAQFRLGIVYLVGHEATPQNEIEALAWFIIAAEAGSEIAAAYRDERTQVLGKATARQAVLRSRTLLHPERLADEDERSDPRRRGLSVTTN